LPPPTPTLFPYTTLFRSRLAGGTREAGAQLRWSDRAGLGGDALQRPESRIDRLFRAARGCQCRQRQQQRRRGNEDAERNKIGVPDRKSTRLNSSHVSISY